MCLKFHDLFEAVDLDCISDPESESFRVAYSATRHYFFSGPLHFVVPWFLPACSVVPQILPRLLVSVHCSAFLNTSGVLSKKMLSVILTFGSVLTRKMHLEVQWGFPCQSWESLALESRRLRGWLHYKWAIWVVEKVAFLSPSFFMSKARLIVLSHKIWRVD